MKPIRVLGLVSLLACLAPSLAAAQTAGPDEVDLRNGGMLRGTIVSIEPTREVVILIQGTGEPRHIPWAEVAATKRGAAASPPPVAPPTPPPPPPPPFREVVGPSDGAPLVHIRSDSPIELHEVVSSIAVVGYGGAAYGQITRAVCRAPCDRVVDGRAGQLFFFGGPGTTQSSRFQLTERGPNVLVDVKPGSVGLRVGGWVVLTLGAVALTSGVSLIVLGSNSTSMDSNGNFSSGTDSGMVTGGAVAAALGGGLLVGGIVMLVKSVTGYEFVSPTGSSVGAAPTPLSFAF